MHFSFPTEAANADTLGDDAPNEAGASARAKGADARRDPYTRSRATYRSHDEGKPGKDINAAGFIKDKDSQKP